MTERRGWVVRRLGALVLVLVLVLGGLFVEGAVLTRTAEAKTGVAATKVVKKAKKKIGKKKAIKIALKKAGFKKSQVKRIDVDLDREKGRLIYEVEFVKGRYEYEFDIDAYTGKVVSRDKDRIG